MPLWTAFLCLPNYTFNPKFNEHTSCPSDAALDKVIAGSDGATGLSDWFLPSDFFFHGQPRRSISGYCFLSSEHIIDFSYLSSLQGRGHGVNSKNEQKKQQNGGHSTDDQWEKRNVNFTRNDFEFCGCWSSQNYIDIEIEMRAWSSDAKFIQASHQKINSLRSQALITQ